MPEVRRSVCQQPRGHHVDPRQLAPVVGAKLPHPSLDLPLVKAVRAPELRQAGPAPVEVMQPCQGVDEGVRDGTAPPGVVQRRRHRQGRAAVHPLHQVEHGAEDSAVFAQSDDAGMGHCAAG